MPRSEEAGGRRLLVPLVLTILAASCVPLSVMSQTGSAEPAKAPKHVAFPAAQHELELASKDWARSRESKVLRAYFIDDHWKDLPGERNVPVVIFNHRKGGAAVKGAPGEDGVCFRYDCSLVQKRAANGKVLSPFLDCNEDIFQKVTCTSVGGLP